MIKTYVIDTNVLIQAPYALECFEDNNLVLPLVVLEELDGLKKSDGEKGANARATVRKLEEYRQKGDLLQGVKLAKGGTLRIEKNFINIELPPDLPDDNRILKVCKGLVEAEKDTQVILITKDIVLRMKAQIMGIRAEDFEREQISADDAQYTGRIAAYIPEDKVKEFKKKGVLLGEVYQSDEEGNHIEMKFHENEFVILNPDQSAKKTLLGRVSGGKIVPLVYKKSKPYGVSPRNVGQYFMQEALMTDAEEAPLVIIKGMAGTAKTFYALAVGMEKVYNNPTQEYRRVIVCRPNAQFDDDIGFLPGDEKEKIAPLMRPVIDNLEQILDNPYEGTKTPMTFNPKKVFDFELEKTLDEKVLVRELLPAVEKKQKRSIEIDVTNTNRTFGTIFGSEITRRYPEGLEEDSYVVHCKGAGGQSFGAFIPKGLTLELTGDSNDYFGKGLSGGKLVVYPPKGIRYKAEENIIIGNVALYGATSGKVFINGVAGERFAVRNSGATAVVEGVGDHGCEYMTGVRVAVLGGTGKNFAAGMSGGVAYVLDMENDLYTRVNKEMVHIEHVTTKIDVGELKSMIEEHVANTNSELGKKILDNFTEYLPKFKKIIPIDYERMLTTILQMEEQGMSSEQAKTEAFYAIKEGR